MKLYYIGGLYCWQDGLCIRASPIYYAWRMKCSLLIKRLLLRQFFDVLEHTLVNAVDAGVAP